MNLKFNQRITSHFEKRKERKQVHKKIHCFRPSTPTTSIRELCIVIEMQCLLKKKNETQLKSIIIVCYSQFIQTIKQTRTRNS